MTTTGKLERSTYGGKAIIHVFCETCRHTKRFDETEFEALNKSKRAFTCSKCGGKKTSVRRGWDLQAT